MKDWLEKNPIATFLLCFGAVAFVLYGPFSCGGDEPEDDEGSAVLCDYVCLSTDDGQNACEWYCEDPQIEVSCNHCEYVIRSGTAKFECVQCDVGTY